MILLGLSFDFHDSAAAILRDGKILAAAEEERFSRKKHDNSIPEKSIRYCLEQTGLTVEKIDAVVFYEKTLLKFDRLVWSSRKTKNEDFLENALDQWIFREKFLVKERIAQILESDRFDFVEVEHHRSHAASAFYTSEFPEATIVTLDGLGEYETMTVSFGKGNQIEKLYSMELPDSVGLFYSAFTAYLGFEVNEGEYKVMGMAGFGEPVFYEKIKRLYNLNSDGTVAFDHDYFEFLCPTDGHTAERFHELFGDSRAPESDFPTNTEEASAMDKSLVDQGKYFADMAASVQKCTEEIILHITSHAVRKTGCKNLCLAGGVALNSSANGRVQRELGANIHVHPAAGDAGGAVGAALSHYFSCQPKAKREALESPFLGKAYDTDEILSAIKDHDVGNFQKYNDENELLFKVAEAISEAKVVGWLQGRFEWGPRALGGRSILADPSNPDIQGIVNEKIKFREKFRPFAPSVLEEHAEKFFEIETPYGLTAPEYFMLAICKVRPEWIGKLPAITHADGTARVQLVSKKTNPRYHELIHQFHKLTGFPILLNTSFNLRGEPIVSSPADALKTFFWSDMDLLVLNDYLITKE